MSLHLSVNQDRKVNLLYSEAMAHLMVGVIVLDEQGRVLESNAMSKSIIAMADGLRISDNQLEATYGADHAAQWWMRWRIFFMSCAELFGYDKGQQWWVSHYLFERPSA